MGSELSGTDLDIAVSTEVIADVDGQGAITIPAKKLAEIAGEYIKKGSLVYIEGRIETNSWKDKNGVERETKNIIAEKMKMVGGNRSNSNQSSREDFNEESSENIPF